MGCNEYWRMGKRLCKLQALGSMVMERRQARREQSQEAFVHAPRHSLNSMWRQRTGRMGIGLHFHSSSMKGNSPGLGIRVQI